MHNSSPYSTGLLVVSTITNLPFLRQVGRYGKPIFLSTGMARLGEIEAALEVLEASGTSRERVTVLHCNTEYPTPMTDVNLKAMLAIRNALGVQVGYSDHTLGIEVPIAAVAMGAAAVATARVEPATRSTWTRSWARRSARRMRRATCRSISWTTRSRAASPSSGPGN